MAETLRRRTEIIPALMFALIPLVFLAAIALFQLLVNVPETERAHEATNLSFRTILAIKAVDEAVQDAERGQRGYLITGKEVYLDPYNAAKERLPRLMEELQAGTIQSPDQQAHLLRLQSDLTTKMNELQSTIDAMHASGSDAAKGIVETDAGRISMDAILTDLSEITKAADSRFVTRQSRVQFSENQVATTFVVGGIVSALAFVIGALLLARVYGRAIGSERLLQATLDSVREGIVTFDGEGRLRAWSNPFAKMLGSAAGELKSGGPLPLESVRAFELGGQIKELNDVARRTGQPTLVERKDADGNIYEIFHTPTEDQGHVTTFLDITSRRQTEEALQQAQKLELIGQMTGGVAHDFNNLLTIIIGNLGLLRGAVAQDKKAKERIDMMVVAAERGARLTAQLLAFARRQPLQPEVVNLGGLMQEIVPLLRRAVGEGVEVECVTAGGLWNTTVDASQFQSAVLNLAINGRDAMAGSGKLTIEVGNGALDDVYAARHAEVEPGQYVLFAITDTGKGMDAATMARALDPFFTTKPAGEGTGLGLPQVYGFVKQSGGHLKIYSEVGDGTTVKLYLPRAIGGDVAMPVHAPLAVTGDETILLVDDDEIVRATVSAMLEDLGYDIIVASNGDQALELLKANPAVDLLFTDVVMPGALGGRKLAEKAAEMVPTLKILFTSGYTENAIVHNGRLDPGVELLSKPYDRQTLATKLRRVLDGSGRSSESAQKA